ncbi:MAG: hypothetical protein GY717_19030 [Rhodobacteraceae bacterium]|nr:hypothetical protein [Paracoccaceae bacterium]
MTAIELLCEIIAQEAKVSAASLWSNAEYHPLVRYGYLLETGVISSAACAECDNPHDAEIVFEGDQYGYFCPELGFVPVPRADVQGVVPDLPNLIERLAIVFDCKRRKTTPLQGRTWRIGAMATDDGDVMLYFHPRLQSNGDVRDLDNALTREVRSRWRLVVTAEGSFPMRDTKFVPLSELVELDPKEGRLTAAADPRIIVDIPQRKAGGAPNRYETRLLPLIQARMQGDLPGLGRNDEAKAILSLFESEYPDIKAPSLPTVRGYVTKVRGG